MGAAGAMIEDLDLSLTLAVVPPFVLWVAASFGLWVLNRRGSDQ